MEHVFLYLLGRSAPASVVIAVVILLRFALRDAPKAFRMFLWAVVAMRLLCPYTPESRLGLMPDAAPVHFDTPAAVVLPDAETVAAAALPEAVPYPVPVHEAHAPPQAPAPSLIQVLSGAWLAGFCTLLAWGLYGYLKLRRTVAASLALSGGVYVCDDIPSPFVLGIVRPRVYVPSGLGGDELSCVLAHERAHIRRGDPLWKLCAWLTACLYWFHPLVWVSYALFCRDVELACDEAAIRDMDAPSRAAYSEALLNRGLRRRKLQVYPLAFGETGVKERVRAVLRYRKPALWLTGAAVVVCVAAGVCLLTRPVSADTSDETSVALSDAEAALLNVDAQSGGGIERDAAPDLQSGDVYEWVRNDADANWPNLTETLQIAEFPGVTFHWTPEQVTATTSDGAESVLFYGMPVWSVYLADLNGDGYPEFCSMVSFGSGFIDERINVYDYRNGRLSELQGRFYFNYTLTLENGTLTARQWRSRDIEPYSGPLLAGTLRLTDTGKLLLVPSNPEAVGTVTRVGETLSGELDDAVRAAVIAHDKPLYAVGEFDAESHVVLGIRPDSVDEDGKAVSIVTLYLMSLRESFDYRDGSFGSVSGRSGPLVLTFRMEDGGAVLSDYWEPRDGAYYWPDIREKFPSVLTDAQLDTQTYILGQNQELYRQVVEHWNID
ncbi:MAG: M56 family metallopeptidase, partial [Oscillibacter sp.]|nr:M56 family metallopeptidase [Oscillibacter sp.]